MVDKYEIEAVVSEDDVNDSLPVNRIETYEEALKEYERAVLPHIESAQVWARIDKLFSGVPPFNPQKLREHGQSHVVNADFGDARRKLQKALSAYYNIFYKNKHLADIHVQMSKGLLKQLGEGVSLEDSSLQEWSQIITEEWTYSKRVSWKKKFLGFITSHLKQLMLYGVNHIFFPYDDNPLPESGSIYSHYSTRDSYVDTDKNDVHIVKHEFSLFELIRYYNTDTTGHWNKDALAELLIQKLQEFELSSTDEDTTDQVSYLERTLERLKSHEGVANDFYNGKVEVATLFVKEFEVDGKKEGISHIIFTPHDTVSEPIFFKDRAYPKMSEVILISTLLPDVDKIHEAKGIGHINYGPLLELAKMKCNVATNIKLSGTTFFKTEAASVQDLRKVVLPIGGVAVVPEKFNTVQTNTNLAAKNILEGVKYFENDLDKNSLFLLNPSSSDEAPVGTIQQRAKESVEMQQNNLAHYTATTLDQLYTLIFKKELQFQDKKNIGGLIAKEFIQRCIGRGVPKELFEYKDINEITGLPSWFRLNAYQGVGTGSQIGDSLKIQEAYTFGIPQKLKTRGAQVFKELEVAAVFGQEFVDKLYPAADNADEPTNMAHFASIAANQLEEGKVVQFSPDLDHEVYSSVLLERMQQVAENYLSQPPTGMKEFKEQERQLLFTTDTALQALGSFLALHLTYLAEDPGKQNLFKNILPLFNRLEGLAQGIHANAEKSKDAMAREKAQEAAENNAAMRKVIFEHERGLLDSKLKHIREMFDSKGSFNLKLIQAREQGKIDRIKAIADAQSRIFQAQGQTVQ